MRTIPEVMLILKDIRNRKGITIGDAVEYIEQQTFNKVSKKTLYGWEEGTSRPDIEAFVTLCKLYEIQDIRELFEGERRYIEDVDITLRDKLYRGYVKNTEYQQAVGILLGIE